MWPDRRLTDLFKIEHPIVLAPMAGAVDAALAIEVAEAGGLGSLPVALMNEQQMRDQIAKIRSATAKPINLNFFCHKPPSLSNAREARWRERLKPYYDELGIDPARADAIEQPHAVRRGAVRGGRGTEARDRQLSFRPAGGRTGQAREGCRLPGDQLGDDRRRGALARGARLRRHHRAGRGGGRPSRHVPDRQSRHAGRHLRAGAAGGGCRDGAGDRGGRHHGCARDRGGVRARRQRRADRHRLHVLSGVEHPAAASRRARTPRATTARRSPI